MHPLAAVGAAFHQPAPTRRVLSAADTRMRCTARGFHSSTFQLKRKHVLWATRVHFSASRELVLWDMLRGKIGKFVSG